MATIAEKLKKPKTEDVIRIPSFQIRGDAARNFKLLVKTTNGQPVSKIAAELIAHILETDSSIRRLLSEAEMMQTSQQNVLKEVKHG